MRCRRGEASSQVLPVLAGLPPGPRKSPSVHPPQYARREGGKWANVAPGPVQAQAKFHPGENMLMVLLWHLGVVALLSLACWAFGRRLFTWIGHAREAIAR